MNVHDHSFTAPLETIYWQENQNRLVPMSVDIIIRLFIKNYLNLFVRYVDTAELKRNLVAQQVCLSCITCIYSGQVKMFSVL